MVLFITKEQMKAYTEQRNEEEAATAILGVGGAGSAGQGARQGAGLGAGTGGGAGFAGMLTAEPPLHVLPDDKGVMGGCGAEDFSPSDWGRGGEGGHRSSGSLCHTTTTAAAARQEGMQERARRRTDGATTGRRKRRVRRRIQRLRMQKQRGRRGHRRGRQRQKGNLGTRRGLALALPAPGLTTTLRSSSPSLELGLMPATPFGSGFWLRDATSSSTAALTGARARCTSRMECACKYRDNWQAIVEKCWCLATSPA